MKYVKNGILFFLALALALCFAELGLRFILPQSNISFDERNLFYRFDPALGWFPKSNYTGLLQGALPIPLHHNNAGFRDVEHGEKSKPRLLVIGDSFVWGADVRQDERFSDLLRGRLSKEVLNLGVSGYGTDQELLLLKQKFDEYRPDAVLLLFCSENDPADVQFNMRYEYGGYYKPYFTLENGELSPHGIPVPKSARYYFAEAPWLFRSRLVTAVTEQVIKLAYPTVGLNPIASELVLEMNRFVTAKDARFFIALTSPFEPLEKTLRAAKIPYVTLEHAEKFDIHGNHWTAAGHAFAADKIERFLRKQGLH